MAAQHGGSDEECDTLWVGNLHPKVTEDLLWELFLQGGPLESVSLPKQLNDCDNPSERQHKGFAFIKFVHPESVPYCEQIFSSTELFGQQLKVRASHGRDSGPQRRGPCGYYDANLEATRRFSLPVCQQNFGSPGNFPVPIYPFVSPWLWSTQSAVSPIIPEYKGGGVNYNIQTPGHGRQSLPDVSPSANKEYHPPALSSSAARDYRTDIRREGEMRSERHRIYRDDASGRFHPRSTEKSYSQDSLYGSRDWQERNRHNERRNSYERNRGRDYDHFSHERDRHGYERHRYDDHSRSNYRPRYSEDGYDRSRQEDLRSSLDRIYAGGSRWSGDH